MGGFLRRCLQRSQRTTAVLIAALALSAESAAAAALTWTANSEPDLAGYRVYSCSLLPCSRSAGTATMIATLGRVTRFEIGNPPTVQHYVLTAFDFSNNESRESTVATYLPAGAPPAPSAPFNLRLGAVN